MTCWSPGSLFLSLNRLCIWSCTFRCADLPAIEFNPAESLWKANFKPHGGNCLWKQAEYLRRGRTCARCDSAVTWTGYSELWVALSLELWPTASKKYSIKIWALWAGRGEGLQRWWRFATGKACQSDRAQDFGAIALTSLESWQREPWTCNHNF